MPVRTLGQVEIDNSSNKLTDPWRNQMTVLEHGHLTEDAIESYSLGRLTGPDCETLEEHILLCAGCQDRLQQMDDFIAAFKVASAKTGRASSGLESELPAVERLRRKLLTLWQAFTPAYALGAAVVAAAVLIAVIPRTAPPPAEPALVELNAMRGMVPVIAPAPSGVPLALSLDLTGLPASGKLRVELAGSNGQSLWSATLARPAADKLSVRPNFQPAPGLYWVRLYDTTADQPLLREFGLRLRK